MQLEKLGPYRIATQIGRGGMGAVYAARDETTGETAAVKVLITALAHDEGFRDRFEAEIDTLRKLRHPNIVRLFGFGEQDGILFYAMELVDGTSLEQRLNNGKKFTWQESISIGVEVCHALKHAHDRGVIHRDIKPANLLISPSGNVKLSDFGIAKFFGAVGMTAGGVVGTAEFMSPEQADGRPVGHRCDLYSLGAVLYALLAGRPPFVGRSIPELLQMQRFAQPDPIRHFNSEVPEELETIILQLLEKDPERRIANATLLARRLEATGHGLARRADRTSLANVVIDEDEDDDQTGFDLGDGGKTAPKKKDPVDRYAVTRLGNEPPEALLDQQQAETQVTDALRGKASPAAEPVNQNAATATPTDGGIAAVSPESRFQAVAENDDGELLYGDEPQRVFTMQGVVWTAALLMIGALVWYMLQPPSAETLYDRIQSAISERGEDGLLDVADELETFFRYYPQDKRSLVVQRYQEQLELLRMERQFTLRSKLARAEGLSPIEVAYLAAIRTAEYDPPAGRRQLEQLISLYSDPSAPYDKTTDMCLQLAQRQVYRLDASATSYIQQHLAVFNHRLDKAEAIHATDPQQAREICNSLISLYGDKPWAAPAIDRAKELLKNLEGSEASRSRE